MQNYNEVYGGRTQEEKALIVDATNGFLNVLNVSRRLGLKDGAFYITNRAPRRRKATNSPVNSPVRTSSRASVSRLQKLLTNNNWDGKFPEESESQFKVRIAGLLEAQQADAVAAKKAKAARKAEERRNRVVEEKNKKDCPESSAEFVNTDILGEHIGTEVPNTRRKTAEEKGKEKEVVEETDNMEVDFLEGPTGFVNNDEIRGRGRGTEVPKTRRKTAGEKGKNVLEDRRQKGTKRKRKEADGDDDGNDDGHDDDDDDDDDDGPRALQTILAKEYGNGALFSVVLTTLLHHLPSVNQQLPETVLVDALKSSLEKLPFHPDDFEHVLEDPNSTNLGILHDILGDRVQLGEGFFLHLPDGGDNEILESYRRDLVQH